MLNGKTETLEKMDSLLFILRKKENRTEKEERLIELLDEATDILFEVIME